MKKVRPALGTPAAREPGLGTGRGGDVTGLAKLSFSQCADEEAAVANAGRGALSATQTLGLLCDWRLTNR